MLLVYCDTGGYRKELKPLVESGGIKVCQFKYENKTHRKQKPAPPSKPQYRQLENYTYGEIEAIVPRYCDFERSSDKFPEIQRIVGKGNRVDAQHLDSAYMAGCRVFLTSDKDDVWTHREELGTLLGLTIFHMPSELDEAIQYLESAN